MGFLIADSGQYLIGIGDDRRTFIRAHRRHGVHHIRDQIGVGDHDFLRLVVAQILKLLQHLLRGAQVERRLVVRILVLSRGHDDPAVNLVLRIQKMHVAGSHHRFMERLADLHDFSV